MVRLYPLSGFAARPAGKVADMDDGRRRRIRLLAVAVALALGACGDGDDEMAATSSTTPTSDSTSTTVAGAVWEECEHGDGVYTVEHPQEWRTNDGAVLPVCTLFDPEPIDVEPGTEIPFSIAVAITVENVAADRMTESENRGQRVISEREEEIASRRATRIETEATGDAPLTPEGTRTTRWIVPLDDGRTIVARTHDTGDLEYQEKQDVLDRMVRSLTLADQRNE